MTIQLGEHGDQEDWEQVLSDADCPMDFWQDLSTRLGKPGDIGNRMTFLLSLVS